MPDFAKLHEIIQKEAKYAYDTSNPYLLQMYFHYMSSSDVLGLLSHMGCQQVYYKHMTHYRLVAVCMLRYYYNYFNTAQDGVEWENADSEFIEKKKYWMKISEDNAARYVEKNHLPTILERPRLFSRDS